MKIFLDTNILVYATNTGSRFHGQALSKLNDLMAAENEFYISTQVLREYAKACTSGQSLTHREIAENMRFFRENTEVLIETQKVVEILETFLTTLSPPPTGKPIYDCNLVATMLHYGINTILTNNPSDFIPRFSGIISVIAL
jgi:predicted nucleic acid-binding protein